jgi:hypothetical protein
MLRRVVWYKLTYFSEWPTASIIRAMMVLMIKAVSTTETSINFYQNTGHNNPEDNHLLGWKKIINMPIE